jgi:hypothetical protein
MEGSYGDDYERFMYGPTDRPDEPVTTGAVARNAPPPEDLPAYIENLIELSRQPGAPKELAEKLKLVRHLLGV